MCYELINKQICLDVTEVENNSAMFNTKNGFKTYRVSLDFVFLTD